MCQGEDCGSAADGHSDRWPACAEDWGPRDRGSKKCVCALLGRMFGYEGKPNGKNIVWSPLWCIPKCCTDSADLASSPIRGSNELRCSHVVCDSLVYLIKSCSGVGMKATFATSGFAFPLIGWEGFPCFLSIGMMFSPVQTGSNKCIKKSSKTTVTQQDAFGRVLTDLRSKTIRVFVSWRNPFLWLF